MRLTHKACVNAELRANKYKLTDGDGLYLLVYPNGTKYWRFKYRHMNKEGTMAFGVFPETTLADAREMRAVARKQLQNGIDPMQAKKKQKLVAMAAAANTFELIAREWIEENRDRWSPKHADRLLGRLQADIFPHIGRMPITEIRPGEVLRALNKLKERGVKELPRRIKQTCGQIFRYAITTDRAERNPVDHLKDFRVSYQTKHYAALDYKQLPAFLAALERNDARLFVQTRLAMKLLVLTFVRTGELIGARWDEINWEDKQWEIPPERMKMRQAHIVPLTAQTLDIFRQLREISSNREYIFPSQSNPRKHMSNNTLLKALERMGYKGVATGHGFRATAMSTIKERLGYRHEVVDRQLAHAHRSQIVAAYDRTQFLDDRKKMMQEWADYLDNLTRPPEQTQLLAA